MKIEEKSKHISFSVEISVFEFRRQPASIFDFDSFDSRYKYFKAKVDKSEIKFHIIKNKKSQKKVSKR